MSITLMARLLLPSICQSRTAVVEGQVMELSMDFQPVYQHHDLLIELGRVEMAMEYLEERSENERQALRPRLVSRMSRLRDELERLAV
ncbi:hypothetical protein [Dyella silvae]|uniref:hypothetical protein n=1 Tax=Dyella silvae TaxID=2994424 RepID=UPI0022641601|nr:hypothetical protein [Dyella silvae]